MTFRKADELSVGQNFTVSSNVHYYIKKQVQLLSLLSMNKCTVFL
jgi:hypothetical protein